MSEQKMSIFELLRLIRDARSTKHAPRTVLNAIALRCKPQEGFKAWPSYETLADDTQLNETTVKRAARELVEAKLLHVRQRKNNSNMFFINASLLQQQAATANAAKLSEKDAEQSPFADVADFDTEERIADVQKPNAFEDESDEESWQGGGR